MDKEMADLARYYSLYHTFSPQGTRDVRMLVKMILFMSLKTRVRKPISAKVKYFFLQIELVLRDEGVPSYLCTRTT